MAIEPGNATGCREELSGFSRGFCMFDGLARLAIMSYSYYQNGNRVIRFESQTFDLSATAEQWEYQTNAWIPAREGGLAWQVAGFQPDWDFLPEDQVEDFLRKNKERAYDLMAARNGYCEFCGEVRLWPMQVSRFCSDDCETERNELKRAREEQQGFESN